MNMKIWNIFPRGPVPIVKDEEAEQEKRLKAEKELYEEGVERSSFLHDYTKTQYDYSLERMRRIEDKALKLFASVSIITTALVLTIRVVGDEILTSDIDCFTIILLMSGFFTFISLVVAWAFVFSAVTLKDLPSLTTGEEIDEFLLSNPRNETIWDISRKYHDAIGKLSVIHDLKAYRIGLSIHAMWSTAIFFVIFTVALVSNNLFQEGGMFKKSVPNDNQNLSPSTTQLVKVVGSTQRTQQFAGSVTGKMPLPKRTEGPALSVALESFTSLSESRQAERKEKA